MNGCRGNSNLTKIYFSFSYSWGVYPKPQLPLAILCKLTTKSAYDGVYLLLVFPVRNNPCLLVLAFIFCKVKVCQITVFTFDFYDHFGVLYFWDWITRNVFAYQIGLYNILHKFRCVLSNGTQYYRVLSKLQ